MQGESAMTGNEGNGETAASVVSGKFASQEMQSKRRNGNATADSLLTVPKLRNVGGPVRSE